MSQMRLNVSNVSKLVYRRSFVFIEIPVMIITTEIFVEYRK